MAAPTVRNSSISNSSGVPSSGTIPQPVLGNYIVVFDFAFASVTTGVTDTAGNTYTHKNTSVDSNGNFVNLFTAPVTATGSGTLTVNASGGSNLCIIEVTGNASSTPDDGITSGTFSGSAGGTLSAASITTTVANDLILSGAIDQNGATLVANSGTLLQSSGAVDFNIVQQRTTSATGTFTESFTVPTSSGESAVIVAIAIKGTASGGVTVALSGQRSTFAAGTVVPSRTVALTGKAITSAAGVMSPSSSVGLVGAAITSASGTVVPGLSLALLGQSGTFTSGLLVPSTSVAITGQSTTFTAGTITASTGGDLTLALTGQAATFATGTLTPATSIALNGQALTSNPGTLSPASTLALTGTAMPSAVGTLSPVITVSLTGQGLTGTAGTITASAGGDITIALIGQAAMFSSGNLSPSGGDSVGGFFIVRARRRGSR